MQKDHDTPECRRRTVGTWVAWGVTAVVGFLGGWVMLGVGYGLGLLDGAAGRPLPFPAEPDLSPAPADQ